tara:strand:- start:2036 stop:2353 length:318 start_codon:yes stop_codon:yes gene_type:complete
MRNKGQITIASYKDSVVLFGKYITYNKKRDEKIYLYKKEHPESTLQSIADMFGIGSRERVRVILKRMNISTSVKGKKEMVEAQNKMGRTIDGDFFDSGYDLNYLY